MIKPARPTVTLVTVLLAGQLLLNLVPFTDAQQPWRSNLLNLFSDNFRNLLQQIPSAPLPTATLPLLNQPSSAPSFASPSSPSSFASSSSHPLAYDAYGSRYSRSKDEILQYSDEDPSIAGNGLQQANYAGYNPNYNPNYSPNHSPNYSPNYSPSPYQSPALNSFTGDYYNYQLADNGLAPQPLVNHAAKPAGQFDDDPLYSQYMLNKNKNLDPLHLNKNVFWNDYPNLGLDLAAYNLDNIYNNRFNYNRLPVAPAHVSFVPPPVPDLAAGNNQLLSANRPPVAAVQPAITDLQPAPNSLVANNLVNGNQLGSSQLAGSRLVAAAPSPDSAPQSAYSSFLAANKEALSSLNIGLAPAASQLPTPLQSDQLISANSVEQKYEQAKPFFLAEKTVRLTGQPVDLPPAAPASLQAPVSLRPAISAAPAAPAGQAAGTLPLNDLNQLYNAFASIPFNNNFNTPANQPANNPISGPKVIYYDNFINHQASASPQQAIASSAAEPAIDQAVQSSADQSGSLLLANTLESSLRSSLGSSLSSSLSKAPSNSLSDPPSSSPSSSPTSPTSPLSGSPSSSDSNPQGQTLTTLTASAGAVAPNLSSSLEVTTQPQLAKPSASPKAIRKKPVKIKRKNHQRTSQRNFGSRNRRKDELEAIER